MKRTFIPRVAKAILTTAYESNEEVNLIKIAEVNQIFSYSIIVKQRKQLEELGLISSRLKGKERYVKLTEKGKQFFERLKALEEVLGRESL